MSLVDEHDETEPAEIEPDEIQPDEAELVLIELGEAPVAGTAHPVRKAAVALATVAALAAGWGGHSWWDAAHDEELRFSRLRDSVLVAGQQAALNLSTLDYRDYAAGMKLWEDSTTGPFRTEIVEGRATLEQEVTAAKTISTAKLLEGAVTELDERAGKARIIISVRITVTPASGTPTAKKSRLIGELTRTDAGWKLSALVKAPGGVR